MSGGISMFGCERNTRAHVEVISSPAEFGWEVALFEKFVSPDFVPTLLSAVAFSSNLLEWQLCADEFRMLNFGVRAFLCSLFCDSRCVLLSEFV